MGHIHHIKKRDGRIAEFAPEKITLAVQKAFTAVRGGVDQSPLQTVTEEVVTRLEGAFGEAVISIEDVQNYVERVLMEKGFFDVAKDYILYRYEHTKLRAQQPQTFNISVVKRSGASEPFSIEKIRKTLEYVARNAGGNVDIETIAQQCAQDVYDGMKTTDIAQALILTTRAFIERDPAYSRMASRLLASHLV